MIDTKCCKIYHVVYGVPRWSFFYTLYLYSQHHRSFISSKAPTKQLPQDMQRYPTARGKND